MRVNSPHLHFVIHYLFLFQQQRTLFVRNNEQNAMHLQPSCCAHTITRKISKIQKKIATFHFWSEQIEKGNFAFVHRKATKHEPAHKQPQQ
jgi:hypothetical protein